MAKKPLITIVIPCYNQGIYLYDALGSIADQEHDDLEVIIVNDGSNDSETLDILKKIDKTYDCRVLSQENKGLAKARNAGVAIAKGKYIVCLDADDKLAKGYLSATVQALESASNERIAIATTWLQEFGMRQNIWKTADFNPGQLLVNNCLIAGSMFRKDVWRKVKGYHLSAPGYEDWDFWLSAVSAGFEWVCIPKPLFLYRIRENSMLTESKKFHLENYLTLFSRHEDLFRKYLGDFATQTGQELMQLHQLLAEKDRVQKEDIAKAEAKAEGQSALITKLRKDLGETEEELNHIKHSKMISKAIVAREAIGRMRHGVKNGADKSRAATHQVRVKVAPLVPRPARKGAKALYKMARYRTLRPYTVYIDRHNPPWEKGKMAVSVVIPYFNRADTIEETLNSLATQTFKNFEVLLVDDGSTDEASVAKLASLDKRNLRLEIIHQKNQGVAVARNNGIARSRSKYIVCLDSDDILEPTYLEKSVILLEANPDIAFSTCHQQMFGVNDALYKKIPFDPMVLPDDNMVITAAMFRREAWEAVGGYKSDIGYEDWEFWLALAERGFWGKLLPEALFRYRTAEQSRYVEDKSRHAHNLSRIRALHPRYQRLVEVIQRKRWLNKERTTLQTTFINLKDPRNYIQPENKLPNVLIAVPWMTFGGAETLLFNFCNEIKGHFNISFVTGLKSEHEWEYKFRDISPQIYHLANLFEDKDLYLEFISAYIISRNINILHIIHTSFAFSIIGDLKERHPQLKIIVTVFNDRAEHFALSVKAQRYIDAFSTDNATVVNHYQRDLPAEKQIYLIPNGINCYDKYNPDLFNRGEERTSLFIEEDELAVFFIGRLSEEKNPDIFLAAAKRVIDENMIPKVKFFVIGDGPMRPVVETMSKKINSECVEYIGYQAEVARFLAAADIFVLPSSIEGFPLSILEAMAMQVLVIASDVGAVSEVVESGKEGFVVQPGSVKEITSAITTMSNNREKLNVMKKNARHKVEKKYSNRTLGANYKQLYTDTMK